MPTFTGALVGLLSDIIRPIIREEIANLKAYIEQTVVMKQRFSEFDREAEELINRAHEASTMEEVNALLTLLNDARARLK